MSECQIVKYDARYMTINGIQNKLKINSEIQQLSFSLEHLTKFDHIPVEEFSAGTEGDIF